jgi:hypothetical protein
MSIGGVAVRVVHEPGTGSGPIKERTMTNYLLSVHMVEGEAAPSEEEMQQAFKDVDALNA